MPTAEDAEVRRGKQTQFNIVFKKRARKFLMDKEEALTLVRTGRASSWNSFRERNPEWQPDLSLEHLGKADLSGFNLSSANLCGSDLREAHLGSPGHSGTWIGLQLDRATIDVNSQFPKEYDPVRRGAIHVSQAELRKEDRSRVKIFVSYARANEGVVGAIDQWLRNKGLQIKRDSRDFFAGSRIKDEIMRVMKDCEVILVVHSKESADRPWPEFERELAADLEMEAKKEKRVPPRIVYVVIDKTPFPSISEANKLAVMASGKRFELVCEEIYHSILQLPKEADSVDLEKWSDFKF